MGSAKWSLKISPEFKRMMAGEWKADVARHIAELIEREFITLLRDAPQFSGNYVANMTLGTSGIARRGGDLPFPIPKSAAEAYSRGQYAAIGKALDRNAGFVEKATAHISGKGGWLPEIAVYNPLKYAGYVEDNDSLRSENSGGEHALAKMAERLRNLHSTINLRRIR